MPQNNLLQLTLAAKNILSRIAVYSFLVLLFVNSTNLFAQKQKVPNLPQYDNKAYHFGFALGLNSTNFRIQYSPDIKNYDSIMSVVSKAEGGFNLGIVTDARLGEFFNVRFIPSLSFAERTLHFSVRSANSQNYIIKKQIESTFIDFPFDLKYKSQRLNNGRAYLLVGAKYSLDMAARKNAKDGGDEAIVKLKRNNYSYHFGFGLDVYTTYFKFSPEFKFGLGVNNILVKDGGMFSSSIDKLFNKYWLISFTFE